jgi:hypothetical protein
MSVRQLSQFNSIDHIIRDGSTIRLQGVVDENTCMPPIEVLDNVRVIDLSGVTRVNGAGLLRLLRLRLNSGGKIQFCASSKESFSSIVQILNSTTSFV